MLASITPLGERSRGSSWPLTAGAYVLGSLGAGAAAGGVTGAAGSLLPGGAQWRAVVVLLALGAVILMEAPRLGPHLPSTRRQVNEDWIGRYRGWVYGVAFGAQLGLGVATMVPCSAIYACGILALLSSHVLPGALIGATFGLARGLALVPARCARDPGSLLTLHRRLERREAPTRRGTQLVESLLVVFAIVLVA